MPLLRISNRAAPLHVCRFKIGSGGQGKEGGEDAKQGKASTQLTPASNSTLSGIVFQPMQEALPTLRELEGSAALNASIAGGAIGFAASASLARHPTWMSGTESAVNEQIGVEYSMSYFYHSMSTYFDRDDVGLPGFAAYFKDQSHEERTHAERLMRYQTQRGGRVRLNALAAPESEFWHADKGDALHAAELALALEKMNYGKLRALHEVAGACGDMDLQHFIEDHLLGEQSRDVKHAATFVSQLQRADRGLGVFNIDTLLQKRFLDGGNGAEQFLAGPLAG